MLITINFPLIYLNLQPHENFRLRRDSPVQYVTASARPYVSPYSLRRPERSRHDSPDTNPSTRTDVTVPQRPHTTRDDTLRQHAQMRSHYELARHVTTPSTRTDAIPLRTRTTRNDTLLRSKFGVETDSYRQNRHRSNPVDPRYSVQPTSAGTSIDCSDPDSISRSECPLSTSTRWRLLTTSISQIARSKITTRDSPSIDCSDPDSTSRSEVKIRCGTDSYRQIRHRLACGPTFLRAQVLTGAYLLVNTTADTT